ncbi:hypothetical protein Pse7367_0855 [Thalassoporum mexicanum PCC 7367]|uniref:DUF5684 domain-containing protein n=1 Tax=Thalassoporum mexicanum TaxID=3457544 RepID=UPI00029FE9DA|nr:DUF5684 domain-containing protein [Pseudanabaena sp. PCC 7367]AFY69155.1 hypothetical protein Pse7367_0855 [Pseudanabaena sp. PCC 7367]
MDAEQTIGLIVGIVSLIAWWVIFQKAGRPGWYSIIPFWNVYQIIQIAGRPGWWFLLLLIPFVNLVIVVMITLDIARKFGKGVWFAIGMIFLSVIFYLLLAFGDATYDPNA